VTDAPTEKAAAGWYEQASSMRYWNGTRWTDRYAPLPPPPADGGESRQTLIWALALAFGVAGALAWDAPAIAYFWPLGLGGAGLALSIVAYSKDKERPWFANIAIVASLIAIAIGIAGHSQIEDARETLNLFR
jgi:hypothetical protein